MAELIAGMFTNSRYKRSQGKVARQVTFFAIVAIIAAGAWLLSARANTEVGRYFVPLGVLALGTWIAFRIVNMPRFADFLISVEAEMNKVSWPSRAELYRASLVVIAVIFLLVAVLFGYDFLLDWSLNRIFGI